MWALCLKDIECFNIHTHWPLISLFPTNHLKSPFMPPFGTLETRMGLWWPLFSHMSETQSRPCFIGMVVILVNWRFFMCLVRFLGFWYSTAKKLVKMKHLIKNWFNLMYFLFLPTFPNMPIVFGSNGISSLP